MGLCGRQLSLIARGLTLAASPPQRLEQVGGLAERLLGLIGALDRGSRSGRTRDLRRARVRKRLKVRRRRGEREAAGNEAELTPAQPHPAKPAHPAAPAAVEPPQPQLPIETVSSDEKPGAGARSIWGKSTTAPAANRAAKKGRASMPSWDEIVFGGPKEK